MRKAADISLRRLLEEIPDPRKDRGKRYALADILVVAVVGMLWGGKNSVEIVRTCHNLRRELRRTYGISVIPSHDTLSRVMRLINPDLLNDILGRWTSLILGGETGGQIIIDGKAVRAAGTRRKGKKMLIPYVLNVYHRDSGLVLMQEKIDSKHNEKTQVKTLLPTLDIEGAVVTIDAMGTFRNCGKLIIAGGGGFVLPVKDDNRTMKQDVADMMEYFRETGTSKSYDPGLDKGHGRLDRRKVTSGILPEGYSLEGWPDVKSLAMMERTREEISTGETSFTTTYYISSEELTAEEFYGFIVGHWMIEDGLHYRIDSIRQFAEDRHNARSGHAVSNWCAVRKIAFNILILEELASKDANSLSQPALGSYFYGHARRTSRWLLGSTPELVAC